MEPFVKVNGIAAPLPLPNVDTDQIMPKQFLKGIDRSGLRDGALYDLRFEAPGKPRPDFILNRPEWRDARFLVVGANFGCGSSREHAVWGLAQLGIRALIGTTFGSIFHDNCMRNGVLTVSLAPVEVDMLVSAVADPSSNVLAIDLPAQTITIERDGRVVPFEIDALRKDALVRGLDAVAATLEHAESIKQFERGYYAANPWLA
jgi:3-isopropylmalate/(R)-2-methylmalate dehydratase small subunit